MLKKNTSNALYFSSVNEITDTIWQQLECENSIYYHRNFLSSIEKNHPEIQFTYIVILNNNQLPIAFSTIKIIDFNGTILENNFNLLKNIGKKIGFLKECSPLKLLISGNTFVSGEHGLFIKKNEHKKEVIDHLAKAIYNLVQTNKELKKTIDAFLLKDFINESLHLTDTLKNYKYHPFSVEPNMVLTVPKHWQSFEDYLAAMKTKFRVKAKKAFSQSKNIKIEDISVDKLAALMPEISNLYKNVATNAKFNLTNFNVNTYVDLKKHFGDTFMVKGFYLNKKLVGFMTGVINNKTLDAHFVGINYDLNRKYAIYQRMLYTYIEIAIAKKVNIINFGRTASEIKSSVGATPQELTVYVRHKKTITNKILKLFLQRIQHTPFQQKFPFKKK